MVHKVLFHSKILSDFYPRHLKLHSIHGTKRQLCSGSRSGESKWFGSTFREKMIKKHFVPSEEEAEGLKKKFPDPKKVVDDLFAPFKMADESLVPKLEMKKQLRDSVCKTRLVFSWPVETDVCGVHEKEDMSVNNAYLRACQFLSFMGLVRMSETGTDVYTTNQVIKLLEELASFQSSICGYETNNFRVINLLQHNQDDDVAWDSSLQVLWPLCFTVNSKSPCLDLAYYQTCLKAVMKFKAFGYLNNNNWLSRGTLLALARFDDVKLRIQVKDLSNPDFELFVDASKHGMGAYLISQDEEKIRWLSDRWIPDKTKFEPELNSNLAEFYAFVTALYTWKHKFVGKKVLCYSDNISAVNAINHGVYFTKMSRQCSSYLSLFLLLMEVCTKYNITVVGLHVPRIQNVAADLLSRCDVESFKKIVPTAFERPKKSKKLWFCNINRKYKNGKKDQNDNDPEKPKGPSSFENDKDPKEPDGPSL